jgi:negative regulator of sigma E activity
MAMTDDPFFARLRKDARPLRHEPDEATLARIRVRIQSHLNRNQPTVAQILAAWFRPIVAAAAAIALAAAIGINVVRTDSISLSDTVLEISMAGETWRVGD